jgi:hypothetical protein
MSTPITIVAPAISAPQEKPPAPQKRSTTNTVEDEVSLETTGGATDVTKN